jgi:hypothetical protein
MKKILLSIATIALVSAVSVKATGAFFTDSDNSTNNILSSGTLAMDVNGDTPNNNIFTVDLGTTSNLQPGDSTNLATILMTNEGSLNLGWMGYFGWSGDTALADKIYIKTAQMEFLKPDGTSTWTPTDAFITDGVGSGAYAAYYNTLAAGDGIHKISLATWNSSVNNMMGTGNGVFAGALKPGYKYRLSIQLAMDTSADNTYQNKSLTLNFHVKSTQVDAGALSSLDAGDSQISIAAPAAIVTWMNTQIANQN